MPPQKTNAKRNAPAKAVPAKQKKVVVKESSDDDEDDEEVDEDDIDEDVSLGSSDEDEDVDDEDGSDDLDEEGEDDDDEDEEEEVVEKPAKRAKTNGKEETPAKSAKKEETTAKSAKKEASTKASKKEEAAKLKQEAEAKAEAGPKEQFEDRASAVGPLTEEEKNLFATNFRAMSATSIFVGKLPQDTTDEDLKKLHPSIRTIRRPVSRKGLPATFGFLNFADKETTERALKEIKKKGVVKIRGQEVLVSENGNGQCHPPSTVDRRKLRIYGCPKFVTAETIKKSLPGCVDVLLGDKDKGNSIEAVAVFRTSAETKKILLSQQTLTLNECVCALFYLNISHNVKQHEKRKDRKQAKKQMEVEEDDDAAPESDDQDEEVLPADKVIKFKKENVKPQVQSAKKNKKRAAPEDSDDDEEAEKEPTPKNKKVSMKSPRKTPVSAVKNAKKTPMRKGTPFKKAKTAA